MAFDDTIKLCTIIKNICNSPDSCIMFGDLTSRVKLVIREYDYPI